MTVVTQNSVHHHIRSTRALHTASVKYPTARSHVPFRVLQPLRHAKFRSTRQRSDRNSQRAVLCRAEAPSTLQRVQSFVSSFGDRKAAREAAREIRQLVQAGEADGSRVGNLVDTLISAEVPFKESLVGGGPWVVVYTRGTFLWQKVTSAGNIKKSKNKASQAFTPNGRTVVNRAELAGSSVYVTASGTYAPQMQGKGLSTPYTIKASIERGAIFAIGLEIPLPIKGSGLFDVAYLDDSLRVFRNSNGGVVVQIKADTMKA